jgi:murein DD-endopeptidase MepM/ murein hydrolase activator NlpD
MLLLASLFIVSKLMPLPTVQVQTTTTTTRTTTIVSRQDAGAPRIVETKLPEPSLLLPVTPASPTTSSVSQNVEEQCKQVETTKGTDGPKILSARSISSAAVTSLPVKPREHIAPDNSATTIAELRRMNLLFPIANANVSAIKNSFYETRGCYMHEAADILAPRNTPVQAVTDGLIARLMNSKAGGITVYQYDPSSKYVFYYAHLERYAENLKQGDRIARGQVIGYVGTSGNAPPNTPHLHFSITKMTAEHKWWKGASVDPYQVYR